MKVFIGPPPIPEATISRNRTTRTMETYILLLDLRLNTKSQYQHRDHNNTPESTNLFLRSEVVRDVEELPNLLRSLALDHVRDRLAAHIAGNRK